MSGILYTNGEINIKDSIHNFHGTFVGRVSPIHKGHQVIVDTMQMNNPNNLMIIGSSNHPMSLRHIFSYSQRKELFNTIYPGIDCIGIPDQHNDKEWLLGLDDILKLKFGSKGYKDVVFYGGSEEDISFFLQDRRNVYIINRFDGILSPKISATEVRDALLHKRDVSQLLDNKIIDTVKMMYDDNFKALSKL